MTMENPSHEPDRAPDELDRLLGEAHWAGPAPDSLRRLQGQWRRLMAARPRRRWWPLAAVAAGIVLGFFAREFLDQSLGGDLFWPFAKTSGKKSVGPDQAVSQH